MFKTKEEAEKEVKARNEELLKVWCPLSQLDCVYRCINFRKADLAKQSVSDGYLVYGGKCTYFNN